MKQRTSILLTSQTVADIRVALERLGKGPRARSQWVSKAIVQLPHADPGLMSVGVGAALENFDERVSISLSAEAIETLEGCIRLVRQQDPHQEGVRSAIIRAAIRKALAAAVDGS